MGVETINILLLDDDQEDFWLTREKLSETYSARYEVAWARTPAEAHQKMEESEPAAVLVDFNLGVDNGVDFIREAISRGYRTPMILLTGHGSYEIDTQAFEAGATDYIPKAEATPTLLDRTIRHGIERSRLMSQLAYERARLLTIIDHAPLAMILVDAQGKIDFINPAAERIFGSSVEVGHAYYGPGGLPGTHADGTPLASGELPLLRAILHGETVQNQEIRVPGRDNCDLILLHSAAPVFEDSRISGAVGVFQDVTSWREAERAAAAKSAQVEIQQRLIRQREAERISIATQLHEGFLQDWYGVDYQLIDTLHLLGGPESRPRLELIHASIQNEIFKLRDFTNQLRSPTLASFGLEKSIRSYANAFREKHPLIRLTLDLAADGNLLDQTVRIALFRILQEALNNVTRHAEASEVFVSFELTGDHAVLSIRDTGIGFVLPDQWLVVARQGHLGIVSMREQAEAVGGSLHVDSRPNGGTSVTATVPLRLAAV